jgi:hypothetical protein
MDITVKGSRDIQEEGDAIGELGITVARENAVHYIAGMQEEHYSVAFYDL